MSYRHMQRSEIHDGNIEESESGVTLALTCANAGTSCERMWTLTVRI